MGSFDGSLMIVSERVTAERSTVMKAIAGVLHGELVLKSMKLLLTRRGYI